MEGMRCALWGAGADVHCAADAALLCAACDADVHGANFLASRHRRTRVSSAAPAAKGRDDDDDDGVSGGTSSPPSSCVSTADSATATTAARQQQQGGQTTKPAGARGTRRGRGEAVLEGWAKRMGVLAPGAARRRAAAAARALQHVAVAPRVPMRAAMAAALWRDGAARGAHGGDALRRLETCAGVPARMIVSVASAMGRSARARRPAAVNTQRAGASAREPS